MKLIFENLPEITRFSDQINIAKDQSNAIVSEFNRLPLNKINAPEQLKQLIEDLPGFIESMITPETVAAFPMLKPSKIVELMEIDTMPVRQLIKESNLGFVSEFLELCKNTKSGFEVDPKKLDKFLDSFRIFATTEKELQIAADYKNLIEAANKLIKHTSPGRFANSSPTQLWAIFRNDTFELRPGFYSELVRSTR